MTKKTEFPGFSKYQFYRGVGNVQEGEENFFKTSLNLNKMHDNSRRQRLLVLPAMQEAVSSVLNRYLSPNRPVTPVKALEVGCGTGFFAEFLRLENFESMMGVDLNLPSLWERRVDVPVFQGTAYHLGVASKSVDAVIGLSSFDSLIGLEQAIREATRCLKPGGHLFLFQDVVPDLHVVMHSEPDFEATERYHQELVEVTSHSPRLKILEGADKYLDGYAVEPMKVIQERVVNKVLLGDLEESLLVLSFLGQTYNSRRPGNFISRWFLLRGIEKEFKLKGLGKIRYGDEDIIEVIRMRYLVAERY